MFCASSAFGQTVGTGDGPPFPLDTRVYFMGFDDGPPFSLDIRMNLIGFSEGPPFQLDTRANYLDLGVSGGQINRIPSGGGRYTLEFDVASGLIEAPEYNIEVYVTDLTRNDPPVLLTSFENQTTPPGEIRNYQVDNFEPPSISYRIRVEIDPDHEIDEQDETNNIAIRDFGTGGAGSPPVILQVVSEHDGIHDPNVIGNFFHHVGPVTNRFFATVQPARGGAPVDHVEFTIDGNTYISNLNQQGRWSVDIDMEAIDGVNDGDGWSADLEVIAYDTEGQPSEPMIREVRFIGLPDWFQDFTRNSQTGIYIEYSDGVYWIEVNPEELENPPFEDFLTATVTVDEDVMFIGDKEIGFDPELRVGFGYNVANGNASFRGHGSWEAASFLDQRLDVGAGIGITGTVDQNLQFQGAVGTVSIDAEIQSPSVRIPVFTGGAINVYLAFSISLSGEVVGTITMEYDEENGITFPEASITPGVGVGLGLAALLESFIPNIGAALYAQPTVNLQFPITYTEVDGTTFDFDYYVEVPCRIYAYVGRHQWNIFETTFGPWPEDIFLDGRPGDYQPAEFDLELPPMLSVPVLASDHEGNVLLIYNANIGTLDLPEARLQYAFWDGVDWTEPANIADEDPGITDPEAIYLSDGTPVAAWTQLTIDNYAEVEDFETVNASTEIFTSTWSGEEWTVPQRLTTNETGDGLVSMAAGPNGTAIAAYTHLNQVALDQAADCDIYYLIYSDQSWSEPAVLTSEPGSDFSVDLALTDEGSGMAVWVHDDDSDLTTNGDTYLEYSLWDGNQWGELNTVPGADSTVAQPGVTALSDGRYGICWVTSMEISDTTRWLVDMVIYDPVLATWTLPETISTSIQEIAEPEILSTDAGDQELLQVIWRAFYDGDEDFYTSIYNFETANWLPEEALTEDDLTTWMGAATIDANRNSISVNVSTDLPEGGGLFEGGQPPNPGWRQFGDVNVIAYALDEQGELDEELNYGLMQLAPDLTTNQRDIVFSQGNHDSIQFPVENTPVWIKVRVRNQGVLASEATRFILYDGHPDSLASPLIATVPLPQLEPDRDTLLVASWTTQPGAHDIYVLIDPDSLSEDRNRFNNIRYNTITIAADLQIEQMSVHPQRSQPGQEVQVSVIISNRGGTSADTVTANLYLGDPESPDALLIGSSQIINLERLATDTLTIPWTVLAGETELWCRLEHSDIEESVENNAASTVYSVLADLSILAEDISVAPLDAENNTLIRALITNPGGLAASPFQVEFWDGNPQMDGQLIGSAAVEELPAFSEILVTQEWTNRTPGVETVYLRIETGDMEEIAYDNNSAFRSLLLYRAPDLVLDEENLTVTPEYPDFGDILTFNILVQNEGLIESYGIELKSWIDFPHDPGYLIHEEFIDRIDPDAGVAVQFDFDTDILAEEDHTFFFMVSQNENLEEMSMENNSLQWVFTTTRFMNIPIQERYFETISFNLVPVDLSAPSVFYTLENLSIVYQNDGGMYLPPVINTIGDIDITQGYRVFSQAADTLIVEGAVLDPGTVYSLQAGPWNWIGYPFASEVPSETALAQIVDLISIVMTDDGGMWIPPIHLNTLGNMLPGEGYMVIVTQDVTFQYNAEILMDAGMEHQVWDIPEIEDAPAPTGLPYVVLVRMTEKLKAESPGMIEIYDGNLLVGKSAVLVEHDITPVVAWGGSREFNIDGFTAGDPVGIRVVRVDETRLPVMVIPGRTPKFGENAYADITLDLVELPKEFSVKQGYPNPFNPTITVPFALPADGEVTFVVFNILGQQVMHQAGTYEAGYHRFIFDAGKADFDLGSGMYFLQVRYSDQVQVQKIVLMR